MDGRPAFVAALLCSLALAGCADADEEPQAKGNGLPPGWEDEEVPVRSRLADVPSYRLTASSSFLAKGQEYVRYVVEVPRSVGQASVFFTTTNGLSQAPAPSIDDEVFHYEFMQIRPLGAKVEVLDTNAGSQFRHGTTGHTFTLTYIYGNGVDYQFLAPFEGNPGRWDLEPGFYELVVATDERLTVGINLNIGTDYWHTYYHPQEIGATRADALQYHGELLSEPISRGAKYSKEIVGTLPLHDGEILNLFSFADLVYDAPDLGNDVAVAIEASGEAWVGYGTEEVSERLLVSSVQATREEAFAYVAAFNHGGPALTKQVRAGVTFQEEASIGAVRLVQLLVFGIVLEPLETTPGLPQPKAAE